MSSRQKSPPEFAHLTNLAHTDAREAQFDFPASTVRSRISVLLHSGVRVVSGKSDLSGLRVAVSPGSHTHESLKKLPTEQRPEIVLVANKDDAAQMCVRQRIDHITIQIERREMSERERHLHP